jgi:zinc protease
MAFNGIKGYPHNEMIDKLQQHGVEFGRDINAYTSFDQTVYYVNMPANDPEMVKMGVEILDGWAGNILFDEKEIESERGVIHEEWRGNTGHGDRIRKKTWPIMLKGSLYAERLPIGKEEVIMNFKRQSIVDFFNDWYRPDLQALVIVGDLDGYEYAGLKGDRAMEQKIKDVFASHQFLGKEKLPRLSYEIPDNTEPLIAIATDKEATGTNLEIFWKHKKGVNGTVGAYRTMLVRNLIGMMINERFNDLTQKPSAPVMYAGGGYGGFLGREIDVFEVSAAPKDNRINEAAEFLLKTLKQIDDHGFLEAELERQKEELLSRYTKWAKEENKTQSNSFADEYTNHYLDNDPCPGIRQEMRYAKEFVPEVTLEECNTLVKSWITDENIVVVITAPEKDGLTVPTEKEILTILNNSKKVTTEPWVDNFNSQPLFADEVAPVTPIQTASNTVLGYTEYMCPNGVRFVVKKTELKADEILISSFSFGGTSLYGDEDCYQAENADSYVDEGGIADFSSTQLEKKLKGMNLSISPYIGGSTQGFNGNCSPKDLETTLQLINLYYTAPRKDQEAYERNIENTVQQLKYIADNPQYAFIDKYYRTAYPNDKRQVIFPSEEKVRSLNLDRMFEIYKERFAFANNQTFFFVGNVSDDDIALIAKYLNHLPTIQAVTTNYFLDRAPKFATGIQHAEVKKGIEKQGMLIMTSQVEVPAQELDPQTRMAIQQLGECLSITVTEIIREKNGDAYSPSASAGASVSLTGKGTVTWQFYIGLDPEKAKKVEKDCIKILQQYMKKGCDQKTLNKVQEQMIVQHDKSIQNNSYWSSIIQSAYMYNESRDYQVSDFNNMVKAVTPEMIKAVAAKYFNLNNYVAVTLRPEDGAVGTAD